MGAEVKKELVPAVVAIKLASSSRLDTEAALCKTAKITTKACYAGIEIADIVSTYGGIKDIKKRIGALVEHKDIELLLLYSAREVAETERDFTAFVSDMRDLYGLKVICYR